jgi:hypothetical protein
MTRTILDTCNSSPVRNAEVQDVSVHLPANAGATAERMTFVRGPDQLPLDVVDFALRKGWKGTLNREDLFLTDPMGNLLYPADQVYTSDEAREVLRKFRRAASLFVYLRLHRVTP